MLVRKRKRKKEKLDHKDSKEKRDLPWMKDCANDFYTNSNGLQQSVTVILHILSMN